MRVHGLSTWDLLIADGVSLGMPPELALAIVPMLIGYARVSICDSSLTRMMMSLSPQRRHWAPRAAKDVHAPKMRGRRDYCAVRRDERRAYVSDG